MPESRDYWVAWGATLTFFAAFYALLVALPRHLGVVGLTDWQIGLVMGAFGIASLISRPLAGVLADRWGQRRMMLVGALALVTGAAGVVAARGVAELFLLRVLQAAGYVAFTTAGTALVVALTSPAQRGRRLAIFGAAANVAVTTAPALTSLVLPFVPLPALLVGVALLAAGAGGAALLLPGGVSEGVVGNAKGTDWRALWSFPRALQRPMLVTSCLGLGFGAFFQFGALLAERRGVAPAGLLFTCYGIGIILTRLASARWLDGVLVGHVLTIATLIKAGGLALAAFGQNSVVLAAGAVIIAVGSGLFHPALIAHHAALLPDEPGRATAGFYLAFDLGIGASGWLLGPVLQQFGLTGLYLVAAAAVMAALPLGRGLEPRIEDWRTQELRDQEPEQSV